MPVKKKTSSRTRRSSRTNNLDPNIWLERAQAMQIYANALKDADERAFKSYSDANEEVKKHFATSHRLYTVSILVVIMLLLISVGFGALSNGQNQFFQKLSIDGGIAAVVLLMIMLVRSPLYQAHLLLERNIKVNVAFLSFIRRLQQSDLALRFVFMQTESQDFAKVLMQIQDFQNMIDQVADENKQAMQDLG